MTELERRLSEALKTQQQVFEQKIKEIASDYRSSLKQISEAYTKQISEAQRIIDSQDKLLSEYEELLSRLKELEQNLQESYIRQLVERLIEDYT